jgi:predicted protein tyrosine phosphatase
MTILVCPLSKVAALVAAHAPERIVSLLDPDFTFPETGPAYAGKHLRLHLHDAHVAAPGQVLPGMEHVHELLAFVGQWERSAPLLVHCRAGIGRSTATAFIAACLHNPHASEREIALALRRVSPLARPNETLIKLADAALGRRDRMYRAIVETGRDLSWDEVELALSTEGEGRAFEMPSAF